jgi:acetyl-CoA carboxylase biotin carboxylase subunit
MLTGIDLVKWQIRLAAGEPLALSQDDVQLRGAAMMVRIHAEDPWARFLPGPGRLVRARFPGGMGVRVDTWVYCGCDVPPDYDSLIAKLTVKSADRPNCLQRLTAALGDTKLLGTPTNVAMLQRIIASPDFVAGRYDTGYLQHPWLRAEANEAVCRDVAVMAAVLYVQRNQIATGATHDQQPSNWQRAARQLS